MIQAANISPMKSLLFMPCPGSGMRVPSAWNSSARGAAWSRATESDKLRATTRDRNNLAWRPREPAAHSAMSGRSPGALGRVPWIGRKVRKSLAHLSPGLRPPLTRPPCRARNRGVGLAYRGTGRDCFGCHCQRVMAEIVLHMPGKPVISDLAS
jgi:hypothetical protein